MLFFTCELVNFADSKPQPKHGYYTLYQQRHLIS